MSAAGEYGECPGTEPADAARVIEQECGGRLGWAICDFGASLRYGAGADAPVKAASVIKLPILVHAALLGFEGALQWNRKLPVPESSFTEGSGILPALSPGIELSIRDLAVLMTILSDNTATAILLDLLGASAINQRMRSLGLRVTTVHRKPYGADESEAAQRWGLGVTTPAEMCRLLEMLHTADSIPRPVCDTVLEICSGQRYRDGIPRLLPAQAKYVGKTGAVDGVRNDVGLVTMPDGRTFGISIFAHELPDLRWTADNAGWLAIARLAERIVAA